MKIKHKLIIDGILLILILICMKYDFTGGLLHEILGFVLITGLLIHVFINRRYYIVMIKRPSNSQLPTKHRIGFVINIILVFALIIMLVSSFAISNDLLPAVSRAIGNYSIWRIIHIGSAIIMLLCVLTHVCLHGDLYWSQIRKHVSSRSLAKVCRGLLRIGAVIMIGIVVKTSYISGVHMVDGINIPTSEVPESKSQTEYYDDGSNVEQPSTNADDYYVPDTGSTPTLDEYLGSLNCNLCHRNCSLLAIQCGRGSSQVSQATTDYYNLYGND